MALRDLSFIKYIEAAFRHKLFKDKEATYFNYLGFNLPYKSEGGKKGIFEYARKVLPFAYTNEFADTDEGNLQMAKAVIEKLDKEGKPLGLFIQPQIPKDYDLIFDDAKVQSEQTQAMPAGPAAGGEAPGTMLGGIPSISTPQGTRVIRSIPQTKPPTETAEAPESKLYVADKSGRVVEERTITPTSTTVTKPEAQSKLFIADKRGRVVGERTILQSAGKTLASDAQIGVKKGLTKVGGGFRNILGGIGRGGMGLLGGVAGGGRRLFTRVGLGVADFLPRFSNQISRGSLIKLSLGRIMLVLLLSFFLVGGLAAFAPAPTPGEQPTVPPAPVSSIASCTFTRAKNPQPIKSSTLQSWIITAANAEGISPAVLASVAMHESQDFTANADNNHDGIKNNNYCNYGKKFCEKNGQVLHSKEGEDDPCTEEEAQDGARTAQAVGLMQVIDIFNPDKNLCSITESLAISAAKFKSNGVTQQPTQEQVNTATSRYHNSCTYGSYSYCEEVWDDYQRCQLATQPPPAATPSSPLGFSISCPLAQGPASGFRIICGTVGNPSSNGCRHGVSNYPSRCNPVSYICDLTSRQFEDGTYERYSAALYTAVDVRPSSGDGSGGPVFLPYLDGNQSVEWRRVDGPTSLYSPEGTDWGVKVVYEADYQGKRLRIDLTHLNSVGLDLNSPLRSGHQVGLLKPNLDNDGGGHLHTSLAVDGIWRDSISDSNLCPSR